MVADLCMQYAPAMIREAHVVFGVDAPVPALLGQIRQESSCRANITAWDNGRGLAQFMDATAAQVSRSFPELGTPDPYSPTWALRALTRFDGWLLARVKGITECDKWGATLKGYNAGLGYVQQAQRVSKQPGVWFGITEYTPTRQSAVNFEFSRTYPRKIIFNHAPRYASYGHILCKGVTP